MLGDTMAKLRRHVLAALVVGVLGGVVAAVLAGLVSSPVYSSSGTVQLRLVGDPQEVASADYSAAAELITSAQTLVGSPRVLGPASSRLDPPVSATALGQSLAILAPARSLVLVISTKGRSADAVEAVVSSVVDEFRAQLAGQPLVSSSGKLALEWGSADVRTEVVSPAAGPIRVAASALIAAILLAGAYLVTRVILDEKVRTPRQISELTDVSVVATLAQANDAAPVGLLARNLHFLIPETVRHCVVGIAGVGGNEASSRLVQSLREEFDRTGRDVALIDADLRAHPMGLAEQGLSCILVGEVPHELPRILLAGPVPPNATELVQRPACGEVIESFRSAHAWTLVNCPPVVPVSDTGLLASKLDALLLVVEAGRDSQDELREALAVVEASGGHLAGLILVGAGRVTARSPYEPGAGVTERSEDA